MQKQKIIMIFCIATFNWLAIANASDRACDDVKVSVTNNTGITIKVGYIIDNIDFIMTPVTLENGHTLDTLPIASSANGDVKMRLTARDPKFPDSKEGFIGNASIEKKHCGGFSTDGWGNETSIGKVSITKYKPSDCDMLRNRYCTGDISTVHVVFNPK